MEKTRKRRSKPKATLPVACKAKRPEGRPRILESPEQAQKLGEAYFAQCDKAGVPYLITGLALSLGLCQRKALDDYEAFPEYSNVIKRLRTTVEWSYERTASVFSMFALKNMHWSDRQEHTGIGGGPIESRITVRLIKAGEPDAGNNG